MKRGLLAVLVMFLACLSVSANGGYAEGWNGVNQEQGYVSPETYAVNEGDYIELYQPAQEQTSSKNSGSKDKKYYIDDMSNGIKAKLRRLRYNMQEPHHGQLHEIKLNCPYKLRQAGLLPPETELTDEKTVAEVVKKAKKESKKKLKQEKIKSEKIKKEKKVKVKPEKVSKEKPVKTKVEKVKTEKIKPVSTKIKETSPAPVENTVPMYDYNEPDTSIYDNIYNGIGGNFNL